MKKSIVRASAVCICLIGCGTYAGAQEIRGQAASLIMEDAAMIRLEKDRSERPLFVAFNTESIRHAAKSPLEAIMATVKAKPADDYKLMKTENDPLGFRHQKYQQYYKGIPVQGGEFRAHILGNVVHSVNGEYYTIENLNTIPAIDESAALTSALNFAGAVRYIWEDRAEIENLRKVFDDPDLSFDPVPELWIVSPNFDVTSGDFRLAYRYDIWAMEPDGRWELYVDAQTGEIIARNDLIHSADAQGSANTRYDGTQTIVADSYNGSYRLRETGRGNGVQTMDANTGTSTANSVDFTDADNNWTTTTNMDDAGTNAHFAAEKMYDYLMEKHSRNSIDGNGFKLVGYVHWDQSWFNASWNGQYMRYGDGNGDPLTTVDIGCHEVAHGLTSESANLVYQAESGALNESFSDIFGTAVEWYATPSRADYLIAEDIGSFRSMINPNQYGDPDTYEGTNWASTSGGDNGGVHTNSGVQNFWYYVLSEGKSGTNDKGDAYNVSGIGREKAEKIAFRNLTVYLSSNSNYADARFYALQAAKDLFGDCSPEYIATGDAWHAVGVGNKIQCNVAPTPDFISDVTSTCDGVVQFTDKSSSAPTSWLWDFGDGQTSTQQNPTHTYTQSGTFTVKLTATNAYGQNTSTKTSYLTVTLMANPTVQGDQRCGPGAVNLSATGSGNTLNWYDAATAGNLVNTGGTYGPTVSATTSFWVEAQDVKPIQKGGPADNASVGTGAYFTANDLRGLFFDVTGTVTLKTVKVFANTAGNRLIEVLQGSDTGPVVASKTVNIPAGESRVTLDFLINPGTNYFIKITGATIDLYRNDAGSSFPYSVGGGLISITGTNASAVGYYYYFYDWEIQEKGCASGRTEVVATVNPNNVNPTISASNTTICAGDMVNLDAGAGYAGYLWSDGSTTQTISDNPTNTSTYSVTVNDNGGCSGSTSTTITVNPLPTPTIGVDANNDLIITGVSGNPGYQWYFNGNPISGATGSTYTPTQNGTYTVVVTDANGCSGTSAPYEVLNVGTDVQNAGWGVQLYPNPAGHTLYLDLKAEGPVQVEVLNLIGEKVLPDRRLVSGVHAIALQKLPDGVYLIRVSTQDHGQKVVRVLKGT